MNIDRKKLVTLIAEASGLSEHEVDNQLTELIGRIETSSEKGKALEIKDFGMFYIDEEGALTFSPSEELETEVNFRYAGMEPIEIKKPLSSEESIPDGEGDASDDDIFGFGDFDSSPEPVSSDDKPATDKTEKKEIKKSLKSPAAKPESKSATKEKTAEKSDHSDLKEEKDPATALITTIVTVLIIIVGIIVLADAGYLDGVFSNGSSTNDEQVADVTMPQSTPDETVPGEMNESGEGVSEEPASDQDISADEAQSDANDESAASEESVVVGESVEDTAPPTAEANEDAPPPPVESDEVGEDTEVAGESLPPPPPPVPADSETVTPFGLDGQIQMINSQYYAIIVHSFVNEAEAREEVENLQSQGYRAMAVSAILDNIGQRWRVGIGQFESIEQAQNAASTLPQPYQDNNFIGIIK